MSFPSRIYCDGGVVGHNPSTIGGTWAWIAVEDGEPTASASGHVTVEEAGQLVTNNYTELLAAVLAMESLPDGFVGELWTDSYVTLLRITDGNSFTNIPQELRARAKAERKRLNARWRKSSIGQSLASSGKPCLLICLLGGHPTKADLLKGSRQDGTPVSEWNVWADKECARMAGELRKLVGAEA